MLRRFLTHIRRLAPFGPALALAVLAAGPLQAQDTTPAIDLKMFDKSEVDRSKGCTVALWQANRDPDRDRFAYVFIERLGKNHARQPARIKIGREVIQLRRIATGGKNNGYDLFEYQLYKMPGDYSYVILELKLGELEGEAVEVEGGTMTVVVRGRKMFGMAVKGGAGCMTAAAPPPPAAETNELAGIFHRYAVRRAQVPRAFTQAVRAKYQCDAEVMATGITGFQISEESAIWEIPCERFAYHGSAVYALVYLPDPKENLSFLTFQGPKGHPRSSPGMLIDPTWDLKARTVTSFAKGRGLGDCGIFERHLVNAEGQFELIEYREKKACDGNAIEPEKFPLVFRRR